MERYYVTAEDTISLCENNLVTLCRAGGERTERLEPRRLFPVSNPDTYITLLDEEGVERAVIRDLQALNAPSRETVENSLADYYLVPHIRRIIRVEEKYGTLRWTVETDRGVKSFDIRNRNHDIRVYPTGAVRIRDSDDNRYVIDDYCALDAHSRSQMIADL